MADIQTEFQPGEKVALVGGGMLRNVFHVVKFKGWKREGQASLETSGKGLPKDFDPYVTNSPKPLPMSGSTWALGKLMDFVKDLPLGEYAVNGDEIVDISGIGIFGSILNAKVVCKIPRSQASK